MFRRRALVSLFVLCSSFVLTHPTFAQIDTGVIVGRVTDDSGAVLPGVTVVGHAGGYRRRVDHGVATTAASIFFPAFASAPMR